MCCRLVAKPLGWTATTWRGYPPWGPPCAGRRRPSSPAPSASACYHLVATGDRDTGTGGHVQAPPYPGFRGPGRWPAHSPYIWEAGEQCPGAGGRWQSFRKGLVFGAGHRDGLFSSERTCVRAAGPWAGRVALPPALREERCSFPLP